MALAVLLRSKQLSEKRGQCCRGILLSLNVHVLGGLHGVLHPHTEDRRLSTPVVEKEGPP